MIDTVQSNERLGSDTRARIIAAATTLITQGGSEAVTTRAVAAAALVPAPTIYRLFGDKRGLLDTVAEEVFAAHVAQKIMRDPLADPVEDLRLGWDTHVAFGLANPAIFVLISTTYPGPLPRAVAAGMAVLKERVHHVARTGRLRVGEERAVDLIHAMGVGTVLTLLEKSADQRGGLAAAAWDAISAAIIDTESTAADGNISANASALRAGLGEVTVLTPGERLLLNELLYRISTPKS